MVTHIGMVSPELYIESVGERMQALQAGSVDSPAVGNPSGSMALAARGMLSPGLGARGLVINAERADVGKGLVTLAVPPELPPAPPPLPAVAPSPLHRGLHPTTCIPFQDTSEML